MRLGNFCGPSILYLGFSIIQIVIDIYKEMYNTAFMKFIIMILFTIFLNILCKSGLTIVSWLIVFIPFISMTVITTLLLFVFGLDPSRGNLDITNLITSGTSTWRIAYPNGSFEIIRIINGRFIILNQTVFLRNTNPVSFRLADGTTYRVVSIDRLGNIRWITDNVSAQHRTMVWMPILSQQIIPQPRPGRRRERQERREEEEEEYSRYREECRQCTNCVDDEGTCGRWCGTANVCIDKNSTVSDIPLNCAPLVSVPQSC